MLVGLHQLRTRRSGSCVHHGITTESVNQAMLHFLANIMAHFISNVLERGNPFGRSCSRGWQLWMRGSKEQGGHCLPSLEQTGDVYSGNSKTSRERIVAPLLSFQCSEYVDPSLIILYFLYEI